MDPRPEELKTAFKSKAFDVDAIDDLNLEMADLMDQSNEISEMMGRNYNVPDDIDEEELMGELDALEDLMAEEEAGEEVPSYLQDEALPDAPDGVAEPLPGVPPEEAERVQPDPAQKNTAQ
jgi:charged multivesicular body protein 5